MEKEPVTLILQVLQALTTHMQEYWLKITAMERILNGHPDLKQQYEQELRYLRSDPAVQTNHLSSAEILEALRTELLRNP
jgi:hypothetical protein